jgi:hypothetical protein
MRHSSLLSRLQVKGVTNVGGTSEYADYLVKLDEDGMLPAGIALVASAVIFTPAGTITSADVQAAIEELDADLLGIIDDIADLTTGLAGKASLGTSNTFTDAVDFAFGTTTGTKLGTSTAQKIGFWNTTPIVQPTTGVSDATIVANAGIPLSQTDTFDGYTLAKVVKALRNLGILA